jgi:hypothetical protein
MGVAQPEGKINSMINNTGNTLLYFPYKRVKFVHMGDDGKVCNERYSIS